MKRLMTIFDLENQYQFEPIYYVLIKYYLRNLQSHRPGQGSKCRTNHPFVIKQRVSVPC